MIHLLLAATVGLGFSSAAFAQDGTAAAAPQLQPVFSDDFATDTSSDYVIAGDVSWQQGRLTLSEGASVERTINGGPWAQVDLSLDAFPAGSDSRELRVWFILKDATDCYVRLRQQVDRGQSEVSISLFDTGEADGKFIEQMIRELIVPDADLSDIRVEYRHGLTRVSLSGTDAFAGHIKNRSATVLGTKVHCHAAGSIADSLTALTWKPEQREYTAAEQQQIADAVAKNLEMTRLFREGKLGEAVEPARITVEIFRSVYGERHPDYATSLNNLALLYDRMSEYTRAEPLFRQALAIQKSVLGEQHPRYATSLNNLAGLYQNLGDFDSAEPLYQQAIEIRRLVQGELHTDYATNLNNLADLYQTTGDFLRAEQLLKQTLDILKSLPEADDLKYAATMSNLADLHVQMGDYAQAEPLYRQSLGIRKTALGKQHPDYATSLNNLATMYYSLGDYSRVEPLLKEASAIWKSQLGERHPRYATSLQNLAVLYEVQCEYSRAEPLYRQCLAICESVLGEQHPQYAQCLNNLAGLYRIMGDYARAETLCKESLDIRRSVFGERHPDYAHSLNNLAFLYFSMGDHDRAEPLYRQCLEIRKSILGEHHPLYAISLNNLASLYRRIGDDSRAERLFQQAIAIQRELPAETRSEYAISLNNLAALCWEMGDLARAELLLQQAIEIEQLAVGEQHSNYANSLHSLAGVYRSQGDFARAEQLFSQSLNIQRDHLDHNAAVQSERQQHRNQQTLRFHLDNRLANTLQNPNSDIAACAADFWRWKGAVTSRQQAYRQVAGDPQLAPLFEKLQFATRQLSAASAQIPQPPLESAPPVHHSQFQEKRERWEGRVEELTRQRESLEQQIATESVEFRRIIEPLTTETLQSLLPERTAFIDFLEVRQNTTDSRTSDKNQKERRYITFVVRPDRPVGLVELGSADAIDAAITQFRLQVSDGRVDRHASAAAAVSLRRSLWLPIQVHLDEIETVIISPDTALGTLPFAALPGESDGSYLIEQYKFATLPLAGMIKSLFDKHTERPQPEKGLLVLGDVNYDANAPIVAQGDSPADARPPWMRRSAPRAESEGWQSLPGFQQELAIVRDLFDKKFGGGITTLRGDKATEARFIEEAPRHYNLHVVTHGFFADPECESLSDTHGDEEDLSRPSLSRLAGNRHISQYLPGLLSGIVFAGANNAPPDDDPTADGILTASEIATLDLNGVDLVVLSACETGLGSTAGGEGLTGLQRAFHIAGVRSCIATLWEVDDKATQEIMSRFYRYYWDEGQSKIDALRNAQLDLLREPDLVRGLVRQSQEVNPATQPAEHLSPAYWGAFQLSGDWR